MRIKHDLPAYNASINSRTECSERKRRRGQNKKKNPQVHDSRFEFGPHRHWRRELRSAIASLFAPHPLIQSDRLLILLLQAEKQIRFLFKNCMFKL
jgi:hypothetical protein